MSEFMEFDWRHNTIARELMPPLTYNKNEPTDQAVAVRALRSALTDQEDQQLKSSIPQDDKSLLKFLYARKFDVHETVQLLSNYLGYRKRNEDIFRNLSANAPDVKQALECGLPGVLNQRDRKGRSVLMLNASNWDCSFTLITIYRSLLVSLEYLIEDVCNQANGFVIIVDWTELSFRQSSHLKPSALKLIIEGLQDCFPAKFKGVHFIGQPWYVEAALTVIKPFLKDKTKERIHVHGNNLSTLHDYVTKDILPAEMGGELPSYNHQHWLEQVTLSASDKGV